MHGTRKLIFTRREVMSSLIHGIKRDMISNTIKFYPW